VDYQRNRPYMPEESVNPAVEEVLETVEEVAEAPAEVAEEAVVEESPAEEVSPEAEPA